MDKQRIKKANDLLEKIADTTFQVIKIDQMISGKYSINLVVHADDYGSYIIGSEILSRSYRKDDMLLGIRSKLQEDIDKLQKEFYEL